VDKNCVFCKIVVGEIPAVKIWESDDFLSILDINPNTKGVSLVLPKKHYDSQVLEMEKEIYGKLMQAAREVAGVLKRGLEVRRVGLVVEGMGVNHAHVKLYPLHGLETEFGRDGAKEKTYFERYEGYLSTKQGPEKTISELEKVAKEIKRVR